MMNDLKNIPMYRLDYQEDGRSTGHLSLRTPFMMSRLSAQPVMVSVLSTFADERRNVEQFIKSVYADAYDATIGVHYPVLMSVRDKDDRILAALGFRYAGHEPLFLEQYLRQPVETVLKTPRDQIVEIGNLASSGGGASQFLFAALSAYLFSKNQRYAVVTGTTFIEKRLRMLGIKPQRLAAADPSLLLRHDENWGSYYGTAPHILAGCIDDGYRRLQKVLGAHYTDNRPRLMTRLHYRGDLT